MNSIRTALFCLVIAATVLAGTVGQAHAQSAPILSRNQIVLSQGIQALISIRMEPRRSELSTSLAGAVEDDLLVLVAQYLPDTPVIRPMKGEPLRRTEYGRLTCRLIARERDAMVAVFTRCTLGNLLVNIMNREDVAIVPRAEAVPATRRMLEDAVRRIAYSYRKARGKNPIWIPDADQIRRPNTTTAQ